MEIKKSFTGMSSRIASQLANRIQKVDLDSLLGAIGLQVIKRSRGMMVPMLAAFGSGLAVGVLVAPMKGKELRAKVAQLMKTLMPKDGGAKDKVADEQSGASPYDIAAKAQRDAGGNGQIKVPHAVEASSEV